MLPVTTGAATGGGGGVTVMPLGLRISSRLIYETLQTSMMSGPHPDAVPVPVPSWKMILNVPPVALAAESL